MILVAMPPEEHFCVALYQLLHGYVPKPFIGNLCFAEVKSKIDLKLDMIVYISTFIDCCSVYILTFIDYRLVYIITFVDYCLFAGTFGEAVQLLSVTNCLTVS